MLPEPLRPGRAAAALDTGPNVLLAYALRAGPPVDAELFHGLVALGGPLGALTAASFLLLRPHGAALPPVEAFVTRSAPTLVQQLSRTTVPQRVTLRGRIRGKISWSDTYKARLEEEQSPSLFVVLQNQRRFNRPENELLRYLLHAIEVCASRAATELHDWRAWGPGWFSAHGQGQRLDRYLAHLAHRTRALSAHVHLRDVPLPPSIGGKHLIAARTAKNELYGEVASLYELYRRMVEAPEAEAWAAGLESLVLPPAAEEIGRLVARGAVPAHA
jgi:hypothetical protein